MLKLILRENKTPGSIDHILYFPFYVKYLKTVKSAKVERRSVAAKGRGGA